MSVLATTPPTVPQFSPQHSPSLDAPRGGGILLNGDSPHRPSISLPSESPPLGTSFSGGSSFMSRLSPASLGGAGTSLAGGGPVPAINITGSGGGRSTTSVAAAAGTSAPPRIRFAPLPEPQRPRSLSTGRNIGWSTAEDADGNEYRKMEMRNVPMQDDGDDYDEAVDDEEDDEDEATHSDSGSKSRRWSKGMSSSWKVSKKILTVGLLDDTKDKEKEKSDGYGGGMPLKKSVSTGGMIGSWTNIEERKRSMQGLAPEASSHRRQSSVETGSSPQPVKLLNGRVYGARRASEVAEMQRKQREAAEPAFVEWGNAKPETTTTSAPSGGGGRGFLGDADEGSGMEWVKRRRAEREQAKAKREAEEKEKANRPASNVADGLAPDEIPPLAASSPYSSENERIDILTPAQKPSELPTTPIIHVSEHEEHEPRHLAGSGHDMDNAETRAIQIKPGQGQREQRDTFDDDESEEEDDEEDPDAEDDEEDVPMPRQVFFSVGGVELLLMIRTTSSAAGIEVVSRHHH